MQDTQARGFTLIELMIVIAVIAIVAAIALPNLLSARLEANETAAIATLRNVISAEAQFQATAKADQNANGTGEYGTFGEMSGASGVRGGAKLSPPVLSSGFSSINASGEVARHGYLFRLFLPDVLGHGLGEVGGGGAPAGVDAGLAETTWCAYAWPSNYEGSGTRSFFVSQQGDVLTATDPTYSGPAAVIDPGSAFRGGGSTLSITGVPATGGTGRDGNLWKGVQ